MDGPDGKIILSREPIEMVVVTTQLMHGPIPALDVNKLRDTKGGPLQYVASQGQINLTKATNQEVIQCVADSTLKNRGVLYGFFTPDSYGSLSDEGKKMVNPNAIISTNFHEVSLTRANGGFAKYLYDLEVQGLAPWEVITRIGIDVSHQNSTSGADVNGVFFDYRLPESKEEKAFLKSVREAIEAEPDFEVPTPRILLGCVPYENLAQFLATRETAPRLMGLYILYNLIEGNEDYADVDLSQVTFKAAPEFTELSLDYVQEFAQQMMGPVAVAPVLMAGDGSVETLEVQAA
jgi:hypothetical protein